MSQLGNEKPEVRLGGIYALERISRDSEKDYEQIIELLAAYIRENAPRKPDQVDEVTEVTRPKEDIQAALSVLRRRRYHYGEGESFPIALPGTDLRGANLSSVNLRTADLTGANLTGANLTGADLTYAHLTYAHLTYAHLTEAHLAHAHLTHAHLRGAHLTEADLTYAYLTEADLRGAHLAHAHLMKADLRGADLTEADLTEADLTGADLAGANLSRSLIGTSCLVHVLGLEWDQVSVATIQSDNGDIWVVGQGNRDVLKQMLPNYIVIPPMPSPATDP